MPALNFKEIPEAHIANGQQDKWEQFAEEFLPRLGYRVVEGPSRGADGGKDLIVVGPDPENPTKEIRWLVSCKHKAHSGKSVLKDDEQDVPGRVIQHNCEGFIGFYSTLPSSSLSDKLNSYKLRFRVWVIHGEHIEAELLRTDGDLTLAKRYFPISFQTWPRPVSYAFGDIQRASNLPVSPYMIETRMLGNVILLLPHLKDGVEKPDYELGFDLGITIPDEVEQGRRSQEFYEAMETGNLIWLSPGEYQIRNISAELRPFLADDGNDRGRLGLRSLKQCMDVAITIEDDDGDRSTIEDIRLCRTIDSDDLLEFSNEGCKHPMAVTLTFDLKECSISLIFRFREQGASVHKVHAVSKFRQSLAKGGTVTIERGDESKNALTADSHIIELTEHRVTLVKSDIPEKEDGAPTGRYMSFLQALIYIERKTGKRFVFPDREIDDREVNVATAVFNIMKGKKIVNRTATKARIPMNREQAKEFIRDYKPEAVYSFGDTPQEVTANILDIEIHLGPCIKTYYRARVDVATVDELRKKVEAGEDDEQLYLIFDSIEGEPIVEEYSNWLPKEDE